MKKKFLIWLLKQPLYHWVLLHVAPNIRFTTKRTEIEGWQHELLDTMWEPGDFLLAIDEHNLTGGLIPKVTGGAVINGETIYVSHAAFCVSRDGNYEIAEMEAEGYTKSTFYDICTRADRILICTFEGCDPVYRAAMIDECLGFEGAKYNTLFKLNAKVADFGVKLMKGLKLGVRFLACSELVYECDFERRLQVSLEDVAGIGQPYISPKGLLQAKNIIIKADSAKLRREPKGIL